MMEQNILLKPFEHHNGSVNLRDYFAIVVISKQIQPLFYVL